MKTNYISLGDCVDRGVYRIHSRNLNYGVYKAESKGFVGIRCKFGERYLFIEFHRDGDPHFGTVLPKEFLAILPDDIECCVHEEHKFGCGFAVDPVTNLERPVLSRDLVEGEAAHGKRIGFVNEWADTGERLPDDLFPYVKENKALFRFLDEIEAAQMRSE